MTSVGGTCADISYMATKIIVWIDFSGVPGV